MRPLPFVVLASFLVLAGLQAGGPVSTLSSGKIAAISDEARARIEISYSSKPILVYSFASNQFKPYVKELWTLGGENVLLDAPPDHLHHHGLMYAVRANGINFWEEVAQSGREVHVALASKSTWIEGETSYSAFSEWVNWMAPTAIGSLTNVPLLVEEREITLAINEQIGEVALRWHSKFKVGAQSVKLTGTDYNGLGLRFPPKWNGSALHRNSENLPYTAEHKWDVTAARWGALSHSDNRFASTVALFSNPKNPGEARFFSMNNAFAYLSVTQNLSQHPLGYAAGDKFEFEYLLVVYNGEKDSGFLNQRYEKWLKERSLK